MDVRLLGLSEEAGMVPESNSSFLQLLELTIATTRRRFQVWNVGGSDVHWKVLPFAVDHTCVMSRVNRADLFSLIIGSKNLGTAIGLA